MNEHEILSWLNKPNLLYFM